MIDNNGTGGMVVVVNRSEEMATYDALPPAHRFIVGDCRRKISAVDYVSECGRDPTTPQFIASIGSPVIPPNERAMAEQRRLDRRAICLMRRLARPRRPFPR